MYLLNQHFTEEFTTEVITVTPVMAKAWLAKNLENNRKLSTRYSNNLANLMLKGEWKIGEAIKFDKSGNLIDGQHRLNAVIVANIPVKFLVIHGYDTESAQVLDRGKNRNLQDIAHLKNLNLTGPQLSVCKFMLYPSFFHKIKKPAIEQLFTPEERINLTLKHIEAIKFGRTHKSGPNKISSSPLAGMIARAYYLYPTKDLKDFIFIMQGHLDRVNTHKSLSVVQKLVTKFQLKDWGGVSTSGKCTDFHVLQVAYCQSVLYSFLNGKKPRKLEPSFENLFPVPELDKLAK